MRSDLCLRICLFVFRALRFRTFLPFCLGNLFIDMSLKAQLSGEGFHYACVEGTWTAVARLLRRGISFKAALISTRQFAEFCGFGASG